MRLRAIGSLAFSAGLSITACKSSSSSPSPAASTHAAAPGESPAAAGLAFLDGFEGEIDGQLSKAKPGETPTAIDVLVKSGKVRFDVPEKLVEGQDIQRFLGAKSWGIFDSAAKKLSVVSDEKKLVVVIDMNRSGERFGDMSRHRAPAPGGRPKPEKPASKITKTGKYETVAGRRCEDWDVTSDHREATICVAHEGISWLSLPAEALPSDQAWALEMMDGKHFPMKLVGYDKDGTTEDTRVEITKMEKKSVADSSFQYPPGYTVMDLGQFIQGMVAGIPSGGGMAAMTGAPPGAGGSRAGMPPGIPSTIPGLTPEQMQQIRQRIQQAQQRQKLP